MHCNGGVVDLKVIFIPDYRHVNPYQEALAGSLLKCGSAVHFGSFFGMSAVLRTARKYWKPDILHVHWTHPFTSGRSRTMTVIRSCDFILELLLLKLSGIRIVWTVHNIVDHESKFRSLELFFNKLLARMCDRLIVHCPSAKREIMGMYGVSSAAVSVIPHGNYIGSYENSISRSAARERLNIRSDDTLLLYFGQIRPYKGVLELINAFEKLNRSNARLLIAGKPLSGKAAAEILERCRDDGRITAVFGFIPDSEIQLYMNAADIVVLPYRDVLTSGAVLSAISFGKPVIAPASGCIADTLDCNGSFLYPKTEDGLLEAMRHALDTDRASLSSMGRYNLGLAGQFDWDGIAGKHCSIYRDCLK